jgi:integrase
LQSDSEGSSPRVVFGKKPVLTHCRSVTTMTAGSNSQIPPCPHGCKGKVWRDGHYPPLFGEPIQRFSCCVCGFKFSDQKGLEDARKALKQVEKIESMELKSPNALGSNCQICVKETKNLVADQTTTLVIPQKHEKQDLKGAVINFVFYLQQQEKAEVTQTGYDYNLDFLIDHGANLFDPLSVKNVLVNKLKNEITQKDKTDVRKYNLLKAYKSFATAYGIDFKPAAFPKYKPSRQIPYLPPEAHMDQLIAACSYQMAAFLQLLKETAARPVEAMRILWDELDFLQGHIPIKHPAKGCNPRVLRMSEKLSNMLKNLPHSQEKVFSYKNEQVAGKTFRVMRKHAITKTGIKELRKITLYTFRYWRATVEFQETGQEVPVMILLGHKSTKYLWLYVQLAHIYFGGTPKYSSVWVNDREEETKLADAGYMPVRTDPRDGASLYRKQIFSAAQLFGHD